MSYSSDIVLAVALEKEVERMLLNKNMMHTPVIEYMKFRINEIKEKYKNE